MDALLLHRLRTEVLEQQVQLRQGVADGRTAQERRTQILSCAVLDGTDGIEQVERLLAACGITQSRHTLMAGRKGEVLELMALINEDMVDAHQAEVHKVILPLRHIALEFQELHLQVLLALLQSREHTPGDVPTLLAQHVKGFVDVAHLIREYLTLDVRRLRYLAELVVGHDDTGIVVVLDAVEEVDTVGR